MSHSHEHGHGHSHAHAGDAPIGLLLVAIVLNTVFVGVEVAAGLWTGSLALLADAAHNLGDVLGLGLALTATLLSKRSPTAKRTFGWRKSTVLAALANGVLVFAAVAVLVWEAIERLAQPADVYAPTVAIVAAIGVLVNGASVWVLRRGSESDINLRAAVAHLVADTLVSVGVIAAAGAIWWTGWSVLDPVITLVISAVICLSTWRLLVEAFDLTLDAAPSHIDVQAVREYLEAAPDVVEVHDLHVWALGADDVAVMAHLVYPTAYAEITQQVCTLAASLEEEFGLSHATLQAECPDTAALCSQRAPDTL